MTFLKPSYYTETVLAFYSCWNKAVSTGTVLDFGPIPFRTILLLLKRFHSAFSLTSLNQTVPNEIMLVFGLQTI